MMLLLLFFLLTVSSECWAQYYVYGEGPPLSYRRAPVRRASPMEALERLRSAPVRYLPQVIPQVDYAEDYQVYALPPQWTSDEDEYEYEAAPNLSPIYRQEDPEEAYNELMRNYLMEEQQVQRRSDITPSPSPSTTSSPPPPQVTGIPPSPEKKRAQSLVVADPPHLPAKEERGQKEEPLFRPQQTSQRTTAWNTPPHKTPIPLLKQMIQGGQKKEDTLLEELNSLKKA